MIFRCSKSLTVFIFICPVYNLEITIYINSKRYVSFTIKCQRRKRLFSISSAILHFVIGGFAVAFASIMSEKIGGKLEELSLHCRQSI